MHAAHFLDQIRVPRRAVGDGLRKDGDTGGVGHAVERLAPVIISRQIQPRTMDGWRGIAHLPRLLRQRHPADQILHPHRPRLRRIEPQHRPGNLGNIPGRCIRLINQVRRPHQNHRSPVRGILDLKRIHARHSARRVESQLDRPPNHIRLMLDAAAGKLNHIRPALTRRHAHALRQHAIAHRNIEHPPAPVGTIPAHFTHHTHRDGISPVRQPGDRGRKISTINALAIKVLRSRRHTRDHDPAGNPAMGEIAAKTHLLLAGSARFLRGERRRAMPETHEQRHQNGCVE